MTIGNCLGDSLLDEKSVNCAKQVNRFEDCCFFLELEDEVMLCEFVSGKGYYYWVFLGADEYCLMICALEQYADSQGINWQGQRSDYLAIGWYNGVCYVVTIELRDVLSTERQMENKNLIQTLVSNKNS
jgi:hypothetical protein